VLPRSDELGRAAKTLSSNDGFGLAAGLFHLMVDTHLDDLRGLKQLLAGAIPLCAAREKKSCRA